MQIVKTANSTEKRVQKIELSIESSKTSLMYQRNRTIALHRINDRSS